MREAKYLCRMTGTGRPAGTLSEFDEGDPFRPEVEPEVLGGGDGHGYSIVDLRTDEEIRSSGGWCLVTVKAEDAVHAAIQAKYGLSVLDANTNKTDIDTKIGVEATNRAFVDPVDYCGRVHAERMLRAKTERERERIR